MMEKKDPDSDSTISRSDRAQNDSPQCPEASIRNINYFLPAHDHRKIKMHAVERGITLQAIMAEALQLYFDKHGLGRVGRVKTYRK